MLIRPRSDDLRIIGYYTGKIVLGLGILQVPALAVALWLGAWNDATALIVGIALAVCIGTASDWRLHTRADLTWSQGLVTVAVAWLIGPVIVAVPLLLSGHYAAFVDAYFDSMSGLTTTGLTLVQDLDHLSQPINLLRHLTHFAGGQGIVVVVLTVLSTSSAHVAALYVGEGRDDRIVPNVVRTARFIYLVASAYLVIGTAALWATGLLAGLTPSRALYHAITIFVAAFDTGGFSPYSTSMAYYHSASMEAVVIVLMIAGTLSFGLHHALWRRRRQEAIRNLEVRTLAVSLALTMGLVMIGLARAGTSTEPGALLRKGAFTILSAHTGTGFSVNASSLYTTDWGLLAPAAVVLAMALGGMASSTSGGIKAIRVGLVAKATVRELRRGVQPDAAVVTSSFWHGHRRLLTDGQVRGAVTILILYLLLYIGGAIAWVFAGHPFDQALFESTSAAANVGLSVGLVSPDNPLWLKLITIAQMWVGRLEFMAAFALLGFGVAMVRGR